MWLQSAGELRWLQRRSWLHNVVNSPLRPHVGQSPLSVLASASLAAADCTVASSTVDMELAGLRELLLDYRIARAHGKIASSHIVGKAALFLSSCCEMPMCPAGKVYQAGQPDFDPTSAHNVVEQLIAEGAYLPHMFHDAEDDEVDGGEGIIGDVADQDSDDGDGDETDDDHAGFD